MITARPQAASAFTGEDYAITKPDNAVVNEEVSVLGAHDYGFWHFDAFTNTLVRSGLVRENPVWIHTDGTVSINSPAYTVPIDNLAEILTVSNITVYAPIQGGFGFLPEARWERFAVSRIWTAMTDYGSRLVTWEGAMPLRLTDNPVTFQAEFLNGGDVIYRYNGIPTNEVTVGILRNGTAQTLDIATNTTSVVLKYIGDLGDGSADTDGDGLTDWEEIRVYGTDPRLADADGDGLSDYDEVNGDTDPRNPDTDGDGMPDGFTAETYASHPLLGSETNSNFAVRLDATCPDDARFFLKKNFITHYNRFTMKSDVYFTSMRTKAFGNGLCGKLDKLLDKAGFGKIDFARKFVAVKIHFGERGNLAFLRPNFARTVVDKIKSLGGKPFLTDCNTLYVGSRKDAIEHTETAWLNGFTPYVVDCPVIIADGLRGTDDIAVPVNGGEFIKEALIGRAVMDADIVISLNHFKGHEMCGIGGAIKNLGMGCGSRAGKMAQHSDGKVAVNPQACAGCGLCAKICAHNAPAVKNGKCAIDQSKCLGCGRCIGICPADAIYPPNSSSEDLLDKKMAEYAKAVVDGRPNFHINIAMDISPNCDCHCENDAPIVPNIGMFASFDPVACDQAAADAVNAAEPNKDSKLGESKVMGRDHFGSISEITDWTIQLSHAEKIGIGTRDYRLVTVK